MNEARRGNGSPVVESHESPRKKRRARERCSICYERLKYQAIPLTEPEDVPEPRRSWVLCQSCYKALVKELRRSPVHSPLRLRIAIGMVAAERWPGASPSRSHSVFDDHRKIVFIAWVFIIAMLLHLVLILGIVYIAR